MKPNRRLLIALLLLGACGDINHTATDYTQSSSRLATAGNNVVPRYSPVAPGALPPTTGLPRRSAPPSVVSVALSPRPSRALRGSGRLESAGSSTLVQVELGAGASHTTYEGAVRRGNCDMIGSRVASLVPVSADSEGAGRSASLVTVPVTHLLKAPHVLVFGPGGRVEACGAVASSIAPPT